MSEFNGDVELFPEITIDHFTGVHADKQYGFLSHCHEDHMKGLKSTSLSFKSIFCTEHTKKLLLNWPEGTYNHLKGCLKAVDYDDPQLLVLGEGRSITFTLFNAWHCLGSTMFFLEGNKGNALYTGDLRLDIIQGDSLKDCFYFLKGKSVPVSHLYIDTTFHNIERMPTRPEAIGKLIDIIKRYSLKSCVFFIDMEMIGYEWIMMEIKKTFNQKIHVERERFERYRQFPEVQECLTTNPEETVFHACKSSRLEPGSTVAGREQQGGLLTCLHKVEKYAKVKRCIYIKPSAMWFVTQLKSIPKDGYYSVENNYFRVLFSMHASRSELEDVIKIVKPQKIFPMVTPLEVSEITSSSLSFSAQSDSIGNEAAKIASLHSRSNFAVKLNSRYRHHMSCDNESGTRTSSTNLSSCSTTATTSKWGHSHTDGSKKHSIITSAGNENEESSHCTSSIPLPSKRRRGKDLSQEKNSTKRESSILTSLDTGLTVGPGTSSSPNTSNRASTSVITGSTGRGTAGKNPGMREQRRRRLLNSL
eukprot:Nk52_evm45s32 gene=Nk52_evmTU45s32